MRKVESAMINAIENRVPVWKSSNTVVECTDGHDCKVYLHGILIAEVSPEAICVSFAGYETATTRSRINAVLSAFVPEFRVCLGKNVGLYKDGKYWLPMEGHDSVRITRSN